MGKDIKFRPATFYLGIADMLAGEVEGIRKEGEEETPVKHDDHEIRQGLRDTIEEGEGARTPNNTEDQEVRVESPSAASHGEDAQSPRPPASDQIRS
jgi:hypothetical protein